MADPYQTRDESEPAVVFPDGEATLPSYIGRYRLERQLGKGGFGLVYLAHDDQLQRLVAIKVPHSQLVAQAADAEAYLTEARTVANLDHSHIVPVYDVGSTEQFPCFVVSKYIDGTDLATRLDRSRLSLYDAVKMTATVAEALHYAHKQGLVHRDIKPGNILLDRTGQPFVSDFGLALREQDVGKGPRFAGTPAYMSPEQARGEGHRVDGRSDIFSLSVVLYELLTRRRPFQGGSVVELLEQVSNREVRPPRQWDEAIPKEVERICLKALSKRASERYTTAKDMADDLWFCVEMAGAENLYVGRRRVDEPAMSTSIPNVVQTPADRHAVKAVPKGLRSFDSHDAEFFLDLLPGPRDRDGLPDSIRFWKTRIESAEIDATFSVGLIYGPSGCGKTSLVKAGLLPRLSGDVIPVLVEAVAEQTESRLLNGLRKRCPSLPADLGLKETLAALRRDQGIAAGKKVLIVLDQFEQWLHASKGTQDTELAQALRQCDGQRVQCILTVRDDFWLVVRRFFAELEIRDEEGRNSALVDLFSLRHAENVLAKFGRAFGVLPEQRDEFSEDQKRFLEAAVQGLAEDKKVVCVRLALFAEMMKDRSWTVPALKDIGGPGGIGFTFLEGTFCASNAPHEHRFHQKAARGVLKALLPEAGSHLKGHMRSFAELQHASGYADRPGHFADLLRVLDHELRLITPTDPEGKEETCVPVQADAKYYQLTHDFLVPALREWLTRKQTETKEGRAELLLEDSVDFWYARQEDRLLPSLHQWIDILSFTQETKWTDRQRRMMEHAAKYHVPSLRDRLLNADIVDVPLILKEMGPYRHWIDHLLREAFNDVGVDFDARKQLHAGLALLPVDRRQIDILFERLLSAESHEVLIIRDALTPHKDDLHDRLWSAVTQSDKHKESARLRAASALATYDPDGKQWEEVRDQIVEALVKVPADHLAIWVELLRPVRRTLLPALGKAFRHRDRQGTGRCQATNILADYAADDPDMLADLVMDADEAQFAVLYPKLQVHGSRGVAVLRAESDEPVPTGDVAMDNSAKRRANAAVALLKMNEPEMVWPLLRHSPDPRARSYLIHRLCPLGADPGALCERLKQEPDISIRRALLLSLGEFCGGQASSKVHVNLLPSVRDIYQTDADPGVHAAAEWLLQQWQETPWLKQVTAGWVKDQTGRIKRLDEIKQALTGGQGQSQPQWYVNGQGQTMVLIPGPVQFVMGSPPTESGRYDCESQHMKRIRRTFALASKSVTNEQYCRFEEGYQPPADCTRELSVPVVAVDWYRAALYCNWLSGQEGIPEEEHCYTALGEETRLKANYLTLSGYRLPTEAEIEYATRAGAMTSRYFGETDELLAKYAWYHTNSQGTIRPVGALKPNDLGLFDVHGNVFTWCQESYRAYPHGQHIIDDTEDDLATSATRSRVLRGGSFLVPASVVRSAYRYYNVATTRYSVIGFRLARTIPLHQLPRDVTA